MLRLVAASTTLVALAAMIVTAELAPEWSRAAGLDVWNAGAAEADRRDEEGRKKELDADVRDGYQRVLSTQHVVDELIAGDITLAVAVAQLEEVNRERGALESGMRHFYPDCPPRVAFARMAVAHVQIRLEADPDRLAAVMARLDPELRAIG
jgi:hypothetical protein